MCSSWLTSQGTRLNQTFSQSRKNVMAVARSTIAMMVNRGKSIAMISRFRKKTVRKNTPMMF